jgi:hypothetical protein
LRTITGPDPGGNETAGIDADVLCVRPGVVGVTLGRVDVDADVAADVVGVAAGVVDDDVLATGVLPPPAVRCAVVQPASASAARATTSALRMPATLAHRVLPPPSHGCLTLDTPSKEDAA